MQIHFFCFHAQEKLQRVELLESLGCNVDSRIPQGAGFFHELKKNPPDVFVIDLTRSPSQGRDIGIYMRHAKPTRLVPIIFVGGTPEKIARIKEILPDAVYSSWEAIKSALKQAHDNPIKNPVIPKSVMAGYSGALLIKKLGIKRDMIIGLVHAPENVRDILGELPDGAKLEFWASPKCQLYLWFLTSFAVLEQNLQQIVIAADHGRIWLIWPKKTSPLAGDLTQQQVRDTGLSAGLVDYKVCAIDQIWSGLLFTTRKKTL